MGDSKELDTVARVAVLGEAMKIETVTTTHYDLHLPGDIKVPLNASQLQELHAELSKLLGVVTVTNAEDDRSCLPRMGWRAEDLACNRDFLGAVKEVRNYSGCTLMEAKECVEAWCAREGIKVVYPKLA